MKNLFTLLVILFSITVFAQTHKATYSLKILKEPDDKYSAFADEINSFAEDNEFYLYFDKTKSYFTSYNVENNTIDYSDAIGMSFPPKLYTYSDKTFQHNVEKEKLYHFTSPNEVEWTITNENKIIDGYNCIKANGIQTYIEGTKVKVEAWFTPEINYPTGPSKYAGLPGIIVYLALEKKHIYKLEKIKFNDNSINLDKIQFEGEVLSKEKYIEYLKD